MAINDVQNGAGTTILSGAPSSYAPEILAAGTHAGPFVQIEGYGGDAVLTSMTVSGSDTSWAGKTIYDGKPIEGSFSAVVVASGSLLAYRKRA